MQPRHQQVRGISLTRNTVNYQLRLKFEYFQTFPFLMWKSKFYHMDSLSIVESIIFSVSQQSLRIVFPAPGLKKIKCDQIGGTFSKRVLLTCHA